MTALPQIISRFCHPQTDAWTFVRTIVATVVLFFVYLHLSIVTFVSMSDGCIFAVVVVVVVVVVVNNHR
jgi:uncharacterized membrane protein YdbT with pleckstrin-like domain